MQDTPVYLVTGFLESGKTKFIQETLQDPRFGEGERVLVIACEEGEEELDPSLFATKDECEGYPVHSIFNPNDLQDYQSFPSHECPLCKAGKKIDALVNSFGYSKI